jgi:tRNA splicing ligase
MTTSNAKGGYNDDATRLVTALQRVRDTGKKSLMRSTDHVVQVQSDVAEQSSKSALVEEAEDAAGNEIVSSQRASSSAESTLTLTSWKTQEFAYRKTSKVGYNEDDELPTLARGLFTCSEGRDQHRIVVRGYDKFFNEGEMPWTKVSSVLEC